MAVTIKRYQNRKLYNTLSKHYISLPEIEEIIKQHEEVIVIDNQTGADITVSTLSQLIFETRKDQSIFLPKRLLAMLVQSGGHQFESIFRNIYSIRDLSQQVEDEIERRIRVLIETGDFTSDEGNRIREKLISVTHDTESVKEIYRKVQELLHQRQVITATELREIQKKFEVISQQLDELGRTKKNNQED